MVMLALLFKGTQCSEEKLSHKINEASEPKTNMMKQPPMVLSPGRKYMTGVYVISSVLGYTGVYLGHVLHALYVLKYTRPLTSAALDPIVTFLHGCLYASSSHTGTTVLLHLFTRVVGWSSFPLHFTPRITIKIFYLLLSLIVTSTIYYLGLTYQHYSEMVFSIDDWDYLHIDLQWVLLYSLVIGLLEWCHLLLLFMVDYRLYVQRATRTNAARSPTKLDIPRNRVFRDERNDYWDALLQRFISTPKPQNLESAHTRYEAKRLKIVELKKF